jgi:hypothetical protein
LGAADIWLLGSISATIFGIDNYKWRCTFVS